MRDILLTLVLQALTIEPALSAPDAPEFVLAGVGRFAVFADRGSLERDGEAATLRTLQVAAEGFEAGGRLYVGGWSNWRFDCAARTADRLDFASLAEDGAEGPATPENNPPRALTEDDAPLFEIACGAAGSEQVLHSVAEAIAMGRARLAEGARPSS